MFNIDPAELVVLIVLAVVLFGPEKLPVFARKLARVFVYLRDIANNAQTQLRAELGPEFADLNVADLNPKTFVKKHMSAEIQAIEDAKRELAGVKQSVTDAATVAGTEVAAANRALGDSDKAALEAPPPATPYDVEAT